jgi:hypothetical protein
MILLRQLLEIINIINIVSIMLILLPITRSLKIASGQNLELKYYPESLFYDS